MMKFLKSFHNLINIIKTKLVKDNNEVENIVNQDLQSDELQIKLALLIKDIDAVDQSDLKQVEYKKMNQETKNDLFSSYRLDFHTRDELKRFKKKYESLLL
jgi:hypothetical protein